ncbi:hypothetical protein [Kangiella marina]|uniref:DUF2946 domain-containing protein n=1 Tax=Kangiella marina TaxID=1079178 RepID=A0ABP8IB37_9GAMM
MTLQAIRLILLLTLLSVAGQLTAFNQHCDMTSEPNQMTMGVDHSQMDHSQMDHSKHGTESSMDTTPVMPCCDMSSGCDMASCVVMMLGSSLTSIEHYRQSSHISLYYRNFESLELHSLYKPPILS